MSRTDPAGRPGIDVLDAVRALSPDDRTLQRDWPPAARAHQRALVLAPCTADSTDVDDVFDLVGTAAPPDAVGTVGTAGTARFRARRGVGVRLAPIAAAVAVVVAGALAMAVLWPSGGDEPGLRPGGAPFAATDVVDTPRVGPGQYGRIVSDVFTVRDGRLVATGERSQDWIAPDGTVWSYRTGGTGGPECFRFPLDGAPGTSSPTRSWFDGLPTDPAALDRWLRSHVSGSTSRDEAVFVAVGDMLRDGGPLASSRLRASLVSVLSRTGGVTVHRAVTGPDGRAAVRADFVDQDKRPGELRSLYFAPGSFELVAETSARTGGPRTATGGSPAYSSPPRAGATARDLPVSALSGGSTSRVAVVDTLPADVKDCRSDGS
ncbi:hypothetical protein [Jatrophihabitans fulvus]